MYSGGDVGVVVCECVGHHSVLRCGGGVGRWKNTVKWDLAHPGVHEEGLGGSVNNLGHPSLVHMASTVAKVLHLALPPDAQETVHLRVLPPPRIHLPL